MKKLSIILGLTALTIASFQAQAACSSTKAKLLATQFVGDQIACESAGKDCDVKWLNKLFDTDEVIRQAPINYDKYKFVVNNFLFDGYEIKGVKTTSNEYIVEFTGYNFANGWYRDIAMYINKECKIKPLKVYKSSFPNELFVDYFKDGYEGGNISDLK